MSIRMLPKPTDSAIETFLLCISNYSDALLKERLAAVANDVDSESKAFDAAACITATHTIAPRDNVAGVVSKKEMVNVYEAKFARLRQPGRAIYDRLKLAAPRGICPLCGHRIVSTIDHYLDKASYPVLAVTPANLVPSCSDCNNAKRNHNQRCQHDLLIHPYYDVLGTDVWLNALVEETTPPALRYVVSPPIGWTPVLAERVRTHVRVLGLSELYAVHAGEELANIRAQLETVFNAEGAGGLSAHLSGMRCMEPCSA